MTADACRDGRSRTLEDIMTSVVVVRPSDSAPPSRQAAEADAFTAFVRERYGFDLGDRETAFHVAAVAEWLLLRTAVAAELSDAAAAAAAVTGARSVLSAVEGSYRQKVP